MGKHLFVTVGTTKFEKLIECISADEILNKLLKNGFTSLEVQTGQGKSIEKQHKGLKISCSPYFNDFHSEIKKADLVISHAGAGTCLDVLQSNKPLIVVINEDLMDNHQLELAESLKKLGYLNYCTCDTLGEVLDEKTEFKSYPNPDSSLFGNYLDKCMGF